jgi:hypothetical protein
VDPWTGATSTLGQWPRTSTWDHHFLTVDRDGNVLLAAASASLGRTKLARVRVNSGGGAFALQIDDQELPYSTDAPIVDVDEYGLIVRDAGGGMAFVYRKATISGVIGSHSLGAMFQ